MLQCGLRVEVGAKHGERRQVRPEIQRVNAVGRAGDFHLSGHCLTLCDIVKSQTVLRSNLGGVVKLQPQEPGCNDDRRRRGFDASTGTKRNTKIVCEHAEDSQIHIGSPLMHEGWVSIALPIDWIMDCNACEWERSQLQDAFVCLSLVSVIIVCSSCLVS